MAPSFFYSIPDIYDSSIVLLGDLFRKWKIPLMSRILSLGIINSKNKPGVFWSYCKRYKGKMYNK